MNYQVGDLFQINELIAKPGWIGAIVLVTEIKAWGIQGFIHKVKNDSEAQQVYVRLRWECIEYVGRAVLVPRDLGKSDE